MLFSGLSFAQSSLPQPETTESALGWRETWAGVDAARDQWMFYSGMTVAPWSPDAHSNGIRLRLSGGYGHYDYTAMTPRAPCGDATVGDACSEDGRIAKRYSVAHSYAHALVGYHFRLGDLIAKTFVGAAMSTQSHKNSETLHASDGTKFGAIGAVELWLNLGEHAYTAVDASYSTARDETSARWRAGYRLLPYLSIGPELRYDKNIETGEGIWNGRAGAFIRYEWAGGEVSLAGGVATRVSDWQQDDSSPYGTLNVLFQF
ncbi:cellulose biosynthesis protein BcsS [Hyphomicrobium methylovorum]|uniref:cellulose biosynthesis protein BcsS n=1 Tax=Hyphomicrobium methylovorum TaxID=84 RepID=UPI003CCDD49A